MQSIWPTNTTAKPRTILHILSSLSAHNEKRGAASRDALWQQPEFKKLQAQVQAQRKRTADIRDQQDEIKQVNNDRKCTTGYAQYLKATEKRGQSRTTAMLDLYTLYSHMDDTIIGVSGLIQNTAHTGKVVAGKNQETPSTKSSHDGPQ
jgi:hypothetical protein